MNRRRVGLERWRSRAVRRRPVALVPILLTLGNLSAGVLALIHVLHGSPVRAAWFIVIGMVLDGLDGWVARTTRSASRFGVELDSLADMITFGVAPGLLVFAWARGGSLTDPTRPFAVAMTVFYIACTAIRLARFNLMAGVMDRRYFIGLPSPMAAVMLASMVLVFTPPDPGQVTLLVPYFLTGLLGLLMVSNYRYRSSKELEIRRRWPMASLALVALIMAMIVASPRWTLFVGSLVYILSGITRRAVQRLRHRLRPPEDIVESMH